MAASSCQTINDKTMENGHVPPVQRLVGVNKAHDVIQTLPPAGPSKGYVTPVPSGSGISATPVRSRSNGVLLGAGRGETGDEGRSPQVHAKPAIPVKNRSLKLAVRRYMGKDRMFYLVQSLFRVVQEERRACQELVDTFQAARNIKIPIIEEKKEKERLKKIRKLSRETLADWIEKERQENQNISGKSGSEVADDNVSRKSNQLGQRKELPSKNLDVKINCESAKHHTEADNKSSANFDNSQTKRITFLDPRSDSGEEEEVKGQLKCSSSFQKRRTKLINIEEEDQKELLTPIEHELDVSKLVLESVLDSCGISVEKTMKPERHRPKKDGETQTGINAMETMMDKVLHIDARLLPQESTVEYRNIDTSMSSSGNKSGESSSKDVPKTGSVKPSHGMVPTLSKIVETESKDILGREGKSRSLNEDEITDYFDEESLSEERTCANVSNNKPSNDNLVTITLKCQPTTNDRWPPKGAVEVKSSDRSTNTKLLSVDMLKVYETNPCLQKVSSNSLRRRYKIFTQRPKVDTNRAALTKGQRRKYDHAPLPPKTILFYSRNSEIPPKNKEGLTVNSTETDSERKERMAKFLDYYKKYQKEKQKVRYSHPSNRLWENLDLTSARSAPETSPENLVDRTENQQLWETLKDAERAECHGNPIKDSQNSKLKEAIANVSTSSRPVHVRNISDVIPRSIRIQKLYHDFHHRRNGDYTKCKPLNANSRRQSHGAIPRDSTNR